MPEQERKQKRPESPPAETEQAGAVSRGKKLKDEMDRLVDEIDDVLEENAEEVVKSYVQRGGE